MNDLPNKKQDAEKQGVEFNAALQAEDLQAKELQAKDLQAKKARTERIKKMRGWLSPRDSVADDFTAEDEALYYGEGHSGWNR